MKIHHYKKVSLDSIRHFLVAHKSGFVSQRKWAKEVIGCDPSTFSRALAEYKKHRKAT